MSAAEVQVGEDVFLVEKGRTVQGFGPGVSCDTCKRNSVLCAVYFWGSREGGGTTAKLAEVDHWTCPGCFCRRSDAKGTAAPKRARKPSAAARCDETAHFRCES